MQRIREIIKELLGVDELTHDQDLRDIGMNSISFVKIIVALELEYDIAFEDEDLISSHMHTLHMLEKRVTELKA